MFDIKLFIEDFFLQPKPANQKKWEEIFLQMTVHTRKRVPSELLLAIRPNEEQEIYDYRIKNYRAITFGSMNKAFDILFRLFNDINYTIKGSDTLMDYIKTKNFYGYTFIQFIQKLCIKFDIEDPNGFMVWYPSGQAMEEKNDAVKVDPKPLIVKSSMLHYADENVFSFLSHEKSKIKEGKNELIDGNVFWIFTKDTFYKLVQTGRRKDNDYRLDTILKHDIGEIPVVIMGGDMSADGYFESFFAPYLAFGDEAVSCFSDWQAVMKNTCFPHIEEFMTECEIMMDNRQSNNIPEGDEKNINMGQRVYLKPMSKSPFGVTQRKVPSGSDNMEAVLDPNIPSRRFISPDISTAEYSGKSWEKLIEKAEDALHLSLLGLNQSGVAKEMDNEDKDSMITKIANNLFDNIMLNSLRYMEAYLFIDKSKRTEPVIMKPMSMRVKSEKDILNEIGTLKEKNVPAMFMSEATRDLSKKRFSGNPVTQKIFDVISLIDPLYIYSRDEITQGVNSGLIKKDLAVKSIMVHPLLLRIAKEMTDEAFLNAKVEEIKLKFEEMVKEFLPEQAGPLFDPNGNPEPPVE